MNQTPRVSWPLRHRGRLACTRSLERRTAGCVLFVTCYLYLYLLPVSQTTNQLVLYLAHEHTRGLEGQPPVQYEHEVVTGDGDVDTLLQATP